MERYLGADVHAASVTFSVLDASGRQIRRDVVETNGRALVGYLQQQAGDLHLCIEEGEWRQWLCEILSPHLAELVVYRAEWKPGQKSDAIDAHGLAEKLRTGAIQRPSPQVGVFLATVALLACTSPSRIEPHPADQVPNYDDPAARQCFDHPSTRSYLEEMRRAALDAWQIQHVGPYRVVARIFLRQDGQLSSAEILESFPPSLGSQLRDAISTSPFGAVPEESWCLTRAPITVTFRSDEKQ